MIPTESSVTEYNGDGTVPTFTVPFRFLRPEHLRVSRVLIAAPYTETVLTLNTDYAVGGAGSSTGGVVTLVDPATSCPVGYKLRIRRIVTLVQGTPFSTQGSFSPKAHESAFDYLTMVVQQLNDGSLVGARWFDFTVEGPPDVAVVTATGSTVPRSLADRFADVSSARDFGAVGDDVTDDTAAIQAAVNSRVVVYLPPGIYRITAPISIPTGHKLLGTLSNKHGEGTWLHQTSAAYHLLIVGTTGQYNQYNEVSGITFTGAAGLGIRTALTESLNIHDNVFSGTVYGLYMSTGANEEDVKPHIYRNVFGNISTTGIWTGDTRTADAWIHENTFLDCASYALRIGYLDGGFITHNAVFSDLASATENNGFLIHKPIWARISDNNLFQVNGIALHVTSPRWTHIERNTAVWTGQSNRKTAFNVVQYSGGTSNDVHFIGNIAREVYGSAFTISLTATDYEIAGNTVTTAGYTAGGSPIYDGFVLSGITRLKLSRNTVDGAGVTRYWASLQNIAGAKINGNTQQNCLNDGAYYNTGNSGLEYAAPGLATANATRALKISEGAITCDATGGAVNLTLPSAAVVAAGKRYVVVKVDAGANQVTLTGSSSQTINGAASYALTAQWKRIVVVADGANWVIESSN